MPKHYPVWQKGRTPHTDKKARVNAYRQVCGVDVIQVSGATYRGSTPFDGILELATPDTPIKNGRGLRCEVVCSWQGVKPPTTYPNIRLQHGSYTLIKNYSGPVIDDIS